MKFEVTINHDDLVAFNEDYLATTFGAVVRRNRWRSSLSSAFLTGFIMWFAIDRRSVIAAMIVGAVVGLVVFVTGPALQRDRVRKSVNRAYDTTADKTMTGVHEHALTEEGIRTITQHSESLYRWSAFQRVRRTEDYAFLYVGPSKAIVIPARSLVGTTLDDLVSAITARLPDLPVSGLGESS